MSENSCNNNENDDDHVIVMIGGWSPGPLIYLRRFLSSYHIVDPTNKLPMPPIPGVSWCCDMKVVFMISILISLWWMLTSNIFPKRIGWKIMIILTSIIWFRLLALVAVRVSIAKSAQICMETIRQHDKGNNVIIIIGFSWGGAVVAEMIANGMLSDVLLQSSRQRVLMIAPTTSLVGKIAMQEDASLRIASSNRHYDINGYNEENTRNNDDDDRSNNIHVVHGTVDKFFCPHQERWNSTAGITLHRVPDNHVFFSRRSQRLLADILTVLVPNETRSEVPPGWSPHD